MLNILPNFDDFFTRIDNLLDKGICLISEDLGYILRFPWLSLQTLLGTGLTSYEVFVPAKLRNYPHFAAIYPLLK